MATIEGAVPVAPDTKFRGPLRYQMETSTTILEAGKIFSVFICITNPYDVPVTIVSVDTQLACEFLEPYGNRPARGLFEQLKRVFATTLIAESTKLTASNVVQNGRQGEQENSENDPGALASVELQPGNTILREFTLRTRQRNFFTPSLYCLHAQVSYKMDGNTNHDTVKTALNIKAPITALVYGAVPGAIIGTLLHKLYEHPENFPNLLQPAVLVSVLLNILVAVVLVVAFARKKDAQPFISVEDFYGGFFVGFLAGYNGAALLNAAGKAPG